MTSPVAVVTDSAASLPPEVARAWGIRVVPLQVIVDDVPHAEDASLGPQAVVEDLLAGKAVSTSQPSPEAFVSAFEAAARAGATEVVAVLISGKMSGTVNAAQAAAAMVEIPVHVVDSNTLAMATGFAAIAAAAVARADGTAHEVAAEASRVAESSLCVFTVDTLEYLQKGGRISPAVAAIGKVLSVRPVLAIVDGEVDLVERVRTTVKARHALVSRVEAHVASLGSPAVAVMALGDASQGEYGDDAARAILERCPHLSSPVRSAVSAVLAVHTGPGALAAVVADIPRHVFERTATPR
ncbi:MAG: DegV family protein [Actinobacteria bacterium HGW-Actinobacteria-4]|nr:MAG: DegV family protein [Actinobacteria bacterium HGW-Actinobacteria-4]